MWTLLLPIVGNVIDKIFPDAAEREKAKYELFKLQQEGGLKALDAEMQLALAQIKVNDTEAGSGDNYSRRWRPSAGWVCVCGLAYQFLIQPLLPWFMHVLGVSAPPLPSIDNDTLMILLTGMLGLGGLRSFDKKQGTA